MDDHCTKDNIKSKIVLIHKHLKKLKFLTSKDSTYKEINDDVVSMILDINYWRKELNDT